jgi:hypothetical protein
LCFPALSLFLRALAAFLFFPATLEWLIGKAFVKQLFGAIFTGFGFCAVYIPLAERETSSAFPFPRLTRFWTSRSPGKHPYLYAVENPMWVLWIWRFT